METKNTKKTAIITMGLPGSGKTFIINKNYDTSKFQVIDPDAIKETHKDYDPKNPSVLHEWSKKIAVAQIYQGIADGKDLIIDKTGTNVENMYKLISELQSNGYLVTLLYVKVKLQTALRRNLERPRQVSESLIYEKYSNITYAFEILSEKADIVKVIKND